MILQERAGVLSSFWSRYPLLQGIAPRWQFVVQKNTGEMQDEQRDPGCFRVGDEILPKYMEIILPKFFFNVSFNVKKVCVLGSQR